MEKQEILKEYKNQEEKILLSFILDKIKFVEKTNKIQNTNFLNMQQISLVESFLEKIKYTNYILWGGYGKAERQVLIIYPDKLNKEMVEKNYTKIMSIIRIKLQEADYGKYSHRNYLGGIIKLGLEREKIGDILVTKEGADIIALNEAKTFLLQELPMLTRFNGSNIIEETIDNLNKTEQQIEIIKIIVPSVRIDNFVSDLARTSRTKALDIIKSERVFVNGKLEIKTSKQIKVDDIITIRGKGRFVVKGFIGTTRSGRTIVEIEKYI